jgi:hypothetical protein
MVKIISVSEEDVWNQRRVCVLIDAQEIVVVLAVAYASESFPLLDVGVVDANPDPVRESARGHELRGYVFKNPTGKRLYAEVGGVAQ